MPAAVRGRSQMGASPATARARSPRHKAGIPSAGLAKLGWSGGGALSPGLAMALVAAIAVLTLIVLLATGQRGERIVTALWQDTATKAVSLGFQVKAVRVQGASPMAVTDIVAASRLRAGIPILDLDLSEVRNRIKAVGWVEDVSIVRLLPDTIAIQVSERRRLAIWQMNGQMVVIDAQGRRVPEANPALFPELPLIVGDGADAAAADILAEVAQRPRLNSRVEALVRVDSRRWDLRLKDGCIIQLPAVGQDSALIRLDQLDQRQKILDLGFARIDLRVADMVTVRPRMITPVETEAPLAEGF